MKKNDNICMKVLNVKLLIDYIIKCKVIEILICCN